MTPPRSSPPATSVHGSASGRPATTPSDATYAPPEEHMNVVWPSPTRAPPQSLLLLCPPANKHHVSAYWTFGRTQLLYYIYFIREAGKDEFGARKLNPCNFRRWMWTCWLQWMSVLRYILTMSFTPKEEYKAKVQFSLEMNPYYIGCYGHEKAPVSWQGG